VGFNEQQDLSREGSLNYYAAEVVCIDGKQILASRKSTANEYHDQMFCSFDGTSPVEA
jgi:hypothetical protein